MSFKPPEDSVIQLTGIDFETAVETASDAKDRFDKFDQNPKNTDKSRCKALLKFPDGTIFWSSKMSIDADGPAAGAGRLKGSELDPFPGDDGKPEGRDDTSYEFSGGGSFPSETVPYIVLPHDPGDTNTPFHPDLKLGDVAIVIYADKITSAICGDIGPARKIGEASIRVHEALHPPAPDPCKKRDSSGFCRLILNASIEEDVLFFVFPNSRMTGLAPDTIETRIKENAYRRYNFLRNIHHMLTKQQVDNLIFPFFPEESKPYPDGTTPQNWKAVTMSKMLFDDPPTPGNPDAEKSSLAMLLQARFNKRGVKVSSPLSIFKDDAKTMEELCEFCFSSQEKFP